MSPSDPPSIWNTLSKWNGILESIKLSKIHTIFLSRKMLLKQFWHFSLVFPKNPNSIPKFVQIPTFTIPSWLWMNVTLNENATAADSKKSGLHFPPHSAPLICSCSGEFLSLNWFLYYISILCVLKCDNQLIPGIEFLREKLSNCFSPTLFLIFRWKYFNVAFETNYLLIELLCILGLGRF